jgi:hypothetical protein
MKVLLVALATTAFAGVSTSITETSSGNNADLAVHIQELLEAQMLKYEAKLAEQARVYDAKLSKLTPIKSSVTAAGAVRRSLALDTSDYSGLAIEVEKAGIKMGEDQDVGFFRTGDDELTVDANNVVMPGILTLNGTDVDATLKTLLWSSSSVSQDRATLYKARVDYGSGWGEDYADDGIPFGVDGDIIFDSPHTARIGYGRMVEGVFTAPEDGVYYITCKIRVKDDSTSNVEIEFLKNGVDTESFEMWLTTGDSSDRRSAMSSMLVQLKDGDTIYPMSDLTTSDGFMGQTDIFQIAPDRIAFSAVATGSATDTGVSYMSILTESDSWVTPFEYTDVYSDGIFTAPRDGLYYFSCKMRISDYVDGDMEIEWAKNDNEVDGSFEMWLHTGDFSERRAQMSTMAISLEAGDTVYPFTDLQLDTSKKVTFSGFELPPDLPAFKVASSGSFTYSSASEAIGAEADHDVDFERGSDDAITEGVYTIPEDGYYYFTMKVRTGDSDNGDFEIEWQKDGSDASTNNYEMWLHLGDSSNRRSGLSATILKCSAGEEVYAISNLALTGDGDVVASWTFSGFKLE